MGAEGRGVAEAYCRRCHDLEIEVAELKVDGRNEIERLERLLRDARSRGDRLKHQVKRLLNQRVPPGGCR